MSRLLTLIALVGMLGSFFPSVGSADEPAPPKFYDVSGQPAPPPPLISAKVKDVLAANLLLLDSGEAVRLLGVAPSRKIEVKRRAIEFLVTSVKGRPVRLEYDRKMKDDLGRLLAYVYLVDSQGKAGADPIQEDLLWRGYVYASSKYPCKKLKRFRRYEKAARKEKRGIWEGI